MCLLLFPCSQAQWIEAFHFKPYVPPIKVYHFKLENENCYKAAAQRFHYDHKDLKHTFSLFLRRKTYEERKLHVMEFKDFLQSLTFVTNFQKSSLRSAYVADF